MKTLCNLLLSGWALGSTLAFAADGDITRLTELNRSGQSAQAYQLASSMLANWEADPQFDRQYAQAALAAGRPGEAIFALERLLLMDPQDSATRAELARAYALLGSQPLLQADLTTPPAAAAHLQAGFSGYLAMGAGYGENLDAGPDQDQMLTPSGQVQVPGLSQRDDAFGSLRAGLRYQFPLAEHWRGYAEGNAAARWHQDADDLDSLNAALRAGGIRETTRGRLELAVQGQQYRLDDQRWLDAAVLSVDYLHAISEQLSIGPFASVSQQNHTLDEFDSRLWLAGVQLNWRVQHQLAPTFYAGLYGGNENPRDATAASAGRSDRDLRAGFLGLRLEPSERVWLNAEATRVQSRFAGPLQLVVPATANDRRDDFSELRLDVGWRLDQRWSTQLSYLFHDNDSNTDLLKYQRQQAELTLRREF